MGFQKIRYDTGENVIKVKIEDETRRLIDSWTLMMSDLPQWFNMIRKKYGLTFKKEPRDLDWIR